MMIGGDGVVMMFLCCVGVLSVVFMCLVGGGVVYCLCGGGVLVCLCGVVCM